MNSQKKTNNSRRDYHVGKFNELNLFELMLLCLDILYSPILWFQKAYSITAETRTQLPLCVECSMFSQIAFLSTGSVYEAFHEAIMEMR